ncbi:MAG: phage antirepressor KilAC domain-containing protein [Megasphaera sp.]|nr:phage antirepressor KilAC domain-containing protein [Megasphaera sp.]
MALGYAKPENAVANHIDPEDKTSTLIQGSGSNYKSKGTVTTTAIAKDYGMSATGFNKLLHELHVIYKIGSQWFLYAKYQAKGYTHSKTFDFKHSDGRPDCKMQTEWTQKGRLFPYQLLKKHGVLPMIERDDQEAGH